MLMYKMQASFFQKYSSKTFHNKLAETLQFLNVTWLKTQHYHFLARKHLKPTCTVTYFVCLCASNNVWIELKLGNLSSVTCVNGTFPSLSGITVTQITSVFDLMWKWASQHWNSNSTAVLLQYSDVCIAALQQWKWEVNTPNNFHIP